MSVIICESCGRQVDTDVEEIVLVSGKEICEPCSDGLDE